MSNSAIDRVLLRAALVHPFFTRIADAYSTFWARRSALRVKLVLLLAILETSPATQARFYRETRTSRFAAGCMLLVRGAAFGLTLGIAILLIGPVHIVLRLARRSSGRDAQPVVTLDRA
jgi:hypothetical protein